MELRPMGFRRPVKSTGEKFAPLVPPKERSDLGVKYKTAEEKSKVIFSTARSKGIITQDILVALVGLGHSPIQAVKELEQIFLLQKHMPLKAKAMAEERIRSGWHDAQKDVLRILRTSKAKRL